MLAEELHIQMDRLEVVATQAGLVAGVVVQTPAHLAAAAAGILEVVRPGLLSEDREEPRFSVRPLLY